MSSEPTPPPDAPSIGTAAEEPVTAPSRRRSTRRPSTRAVPASGTAASEAPASTTSDEDAQTPAPAPARRSRGRVSFAASARAAAAGVSGDAVALPAVPEASDDDAPGLAIPAEADLSVVRDALISGEEAPTRSRRRRRSRGSRGTTTDAADAIVEITTTTAGEDIETELAAAVDDLSVEQAEAGAPGTSRRRRRRGRGGRAGAVEAGVAGESATGDEVSDAIVAPAFDRAGSGSTASITEDHAEASPALPRRFDRGQWRDRLIRGTAARPERPAPAVVTPTAPAPIAAAERDEGADSHQPARTTVEIPLRSRAAPAQPPAQPASPIVAPSPAIAPPRAMPVRAVPAAVALPAIPGGGSLEERIERLLLQQQQALQSLAATMTALQSTMERMSTVGIAAGMPRAGVFVDAPNVVYAAESARVNLDYGRMLDFLCRGREMVHAIVYAPVTEDTGYRLETQRFVAPFLRKGYKMVTKPLKRFPDGTAKGNFDIELAIDIVTMSQRLDVVILISGDSDFSRLIELIQSRGVRVEVVAFASNVSWELVQMADVFIDIGEYLHEFRAP